MTKEFAEQMRSYLPNIDPEGTLTQSELAKILDIDHSYLSRILSGTRNARPDQAINLMTKLKVPDDKAVEFLLVASGHSEEETKKILQPIKQVIDLKPGEIVTLIKGKDRHLYKIPKRNSTHAS